MAVDKLVDSAQLNADLTSVANAIRTKGGTSAQMAFPAGFVSAVNAIPTGGGRTLHFRATSTTVLPRFTGVTFDEDIDEIVVDLNHINNIGQWNYSGHKSNPKLTFINGDNVTSINDIFRQGMTYREVDFGGIAPASINRAFYQGNYTPGEIVDGVIKIFVPDSVYVHGLDLSNVTSASGFVYDPNTELTIIFSGVLHIDLSYSDPKITAESILSLISCLEDLTGTGTTHTLTLGNNKNKLTTEQIAVATNKGWTVA